MTTAVPLLGSPRSTTHLHHHDVLVRLSRHGAEHRCRREENREAGGKGQRVL